MKKLNLIGQRFGKLLVTNEVGLTAEGRATWMCSCDCGGNKVAATNTLRKGSTRSCGCVYSDVARTRTNYHGLSHSRTMSTWSALMTRCFNKGAKDYVRYGARGITACAAIQRSAAGIVAVIGPRPKGRTLDRRDNEGNYTCGLCPQCKRNGWKKNIRWATLNQQGRNTRTNHHVEIDGVTRCITEWAEKSGLKKVTILARIRRGWVGRTLLLAPLPAGTRLD